MDFKKSFKLIIKNLEPLWAGLAMFSFLLFSPLLILGLLILQAKEDIPRIMKEEKSHKRFFIVGAFFSITYCLILLLAILVNNDGFSFFTTSKLSEVGDFLAGAFSPLAFLWLIIGFWMQAHELSLQRQELGEQRKANEEQAKSLEIQTQFMLGLEPEFTFKITEVMYPGPNGDTSYVNKEITIDNKGAIAINTKFIIHGKENIENSKSIIKTFESINLNAPRELFDDSNGLILEAQYNNAIGEYAVKKYQLMIKHGSLYSKEI